MKQKEILGIDVGASGIKGAIVDLQTGELLTERFRVETPVPSNPKAVAKAFAQVVKNFKWKKSIGCGFPAVIKNGTAYTAANIDKKWIGTNVARIFSESCAGEVYVSNDADLAGLAEMRYGAGKGEKGTVLLITIGSGLGSALFTNGQMVANTELGHLYLRNSKIVAEQYTADSVRKNKDLSFEEWGTRINEYLLHIEKLFSPDLLILGGGGSNKMDRFEQLLTVKTEVVPATFRNNAGIIGAAVYAYEQESANKKPKVAVG